MKRFFRIHNGELQAGDPNNFTYQVITKTLESEIKTLLLDDILREIEQQSAIIKVSLEELQKSIQNGEVVMLINTQNTVEGMIRIYRYGEYEGKTIYKRATLIKTGTLKKVKGISKLIYPLAKELIPEDIKVCIYGIIRGTTREHRQNFIKQQNGETPGLCIEVSYEKLKNHNPELAKFLCEVTENENENGIHIIINQVMVDEFNLHSLV